MEVAGNAGPQGLIPTTEAFGTALSDIVRCGACGHMQLERLPTETELAAAYKAAASQDYLEEEAGQRETARHVLASIERHAGPGRLADVGCWVGFLLDEARGRGWQVTGVEPSDYARDYARGRLDLEVHGGDLFAAPLPESHFDVVVLGDVIEHLPRPGAALDHVGSLLAPAGIVALMVPDAGSRLARTMGRRWWSVIPTHVQYFTRASIATLLRSRGFEVIECDTQPKAFTVRYYLERIGGYSTAVSGLLVRGAERTGIAGRIWVPDFRDRMLVIARRSPTSPHTSTTIRGANGARESVPPQAEQWPQMPPRCP